MVRSLRLLTEIVKKKHFLVLTKAITINTIIYKLHDNIFKFFSYLKTIKTFIALRLQLTSTKCAY